MRRPIRVQLIVPLLLVVGLGFFVSTGLAAVFAWRTAASLERSRLVRLVDQLAAASFPLTSNVLHQLEELTGARFLVRSRQTGAILFAGRSLSPTAAMRNSEPSTAALARFGPVLWKLGEERFLAAGFVPGVGPSDRQVVVLIPEEPRWALAWKAAAAPLVAGLLAGTASLAIAYWLARSFVGVLTDVVRQTQTIADGGTEPLELRSRNDEFRDLQRAINEMVRRLAESREQLLRGERLRMLGQLGAGFAHQLRNAAAGARMALDFHDRELPSNADRESLNMATGQLQRMEDYLQRFLRFSRTETSDTGSRTMPVAALLNGVIALLQLTATHHHVLLRADSTDAPGNLIGDPGGIEQMLLNLVMNAIEAAIRVEDDAPAEVLLRAQANDQGLLLVVSDTGAGPLPEIADRMFDPFITSRPEGVGLGLSVAREIARAHGGEVTWQRFENRTEFRVQLPASCYQSGG